MRPLALVRPEPGWSASAAAARRLDLAVVGAPLFEAEPVEWRAPRTDASALLVGSPAVFRLGGPGLAELVHLPVHAVGAATAEAARAAGFRVARVGEGGLQSLLESGEGAPRRFLRLGGEERVRLHPKGGQAIEEITVYRMRPVPVAPAFARALAQDRPLVALHSAAAARHLSAELERLGLARASLAVIALGPRIARAAGDGWAARHVADRAEDAALLAKAAALCKEPAR